MSAFAAIKWARSAPVVRRGNGKPDATAHHVLLVLATYADKDGRARPSVATLAEDSVLAVDTVDAALCRLVSAGLIEAEESYGGSGCVMWRLRMDLSRDGSRADVLTERQERARRATADRVARFRERRNGVRGRYATLSGTVTDAVVTSPDTVTGDDVTVSETVCNGVGDRDVTVSDPESNASDTVTPAGQSSRTAIELPVRTANELPREKRSRRSPPREDARDDVEQLCERLRSWIVRNGSKNPTVGQTWRKAARLMLDADGRELAKALALIDWCQQDSFWRSNIESMPTFRRQYDKLRLQAKAEWERLHRPRAVNGNGIHPTDATVALLLGQQPPQLRALTGGEP